MTARPGSVVSARAFARVVLASCVALAACHGGSSPPAVPDAQAPPTWKLTANPDSVGVHPGESRDVTFTLRDEAGASVAGAKLQFAIVDDPETPESEAQGATLSFDSAITNGRGEVVLQIIAGLRTTFQVRATAPDPACAGDRCSRTAAGPFLLLVFVKAGSYGGVELAPTVSASEQADATWSGSRVLFFDGLPCSKLGTPLPAAVRPARELSPGLAARFDAVNADAVHGAIGYGVDEAGIVRFAGCVDVPGAALLENDTVRVPLPLRRVSPRFLARYKAVSQLQFAPPPIGATELGSAWRELTGCPYDPAQAWLDCTIASADGPPDAGFAPADCTTPARPGPLATKLLSRRGAEAAAGSRCRGAVDAGGRTSSDALVSALFRSNATASLGVLASLQQDAQHLTDIVKLRSTVTITPLRLDAADAPRFRFEHLVDAIDFALGTGFATVDTTDYGAPVRRAHATAAAIGNDLVVDRHGFALRIGSAARRAFLTRSLAARTGYGDLAQFVRGVYALASSASTPPAVGCAALDETLCPEVGERAGCLLEACSNALTRIAARLDAGFVDLDGADVDVVLAGPVPLVDRDGDGLVEALGRLGEPARPGLWTGELRATAGVAPFSGIWLAVP